MLATSIAFLDVVLEVKHWAKRVAIPLACLFFVVDGLFFGTSLPKIFEGAWVPLAIAAVIVVTALTWLEGRRCVAKGLLATQMPLERYIAEAKPVAGDPHGTMVFLTGDQHGVPFIGGTHQWVRKRADEEQVVLLTLIREAAPYVADSERVYVDRRSPRLVLVNAKFGYMERPEITRIMSACNACGLDLDTDDTSFFYADPKLSRADVDPLPGWQREYFRILARNARPLPDDLEIRAERRVELGVSVAL
jgi:KUP system potassium uptake protein